MSKETSTTKQEDLDKNTKKHSKTDQETPDSPYPAKKKKKKIPIDRGKQGDYSSTLDFNT